MVDQLVTGIPQPALAESKHPFEDGRAAWTLVNEDPAAAYTKVHFAQLHIIRGTLSLTDGNGNPVQAFGDDTYMQDFWSDDVPGRVVKVYLDGRYDKGWGFRIDQLVTGVPQPALAESKHPFEDGVVSWTIANPNTAATFTRVHFARLHIVRGDLTLLDGTGSEVQKFSDDTYLTDTWSDPVPGRVVKVQLDGRYDKGWGFRIDDVSPKSDESPLPAFVNGVYVHVGQPGTLWLNGVELGKATAEGDYLIRLPDLGENPMMIETLLHQQAISVTTSEDGGVRIRYSGIQSRPESAATPTN